MKRYTVPEIAAMSGYHPKTILRAIHRHQNGKQGLEAHEPKGTRGYRITEQAFNDWMNND